LTLEEKDDIMQSVLNIIKKYPAYFGEHLDIINEQDIMITENGITSIYRPDRIIKSDKGYVILDFKTGAEHPKHQQQIETYRRTVEGLGIKVADTAVVYL
jgi:hypothetical protein